MDCENVRNDMHLHIKGLLKGSEEIIISAHIRACPECSQFERSSKLLTSGLHASEEAPSAVFFRNYKRPFSLIGALKHAAIPAFAMAALFIAMFLPFETEDAVSDYASDAYSITQISTLSAESGHILDDIILL